MEELLPVPLPVSRLKARFKARDRRTRSFVWQSIPVDVTNSLRVLANDESKNTMAICTTAWAILLYRYSPETEIISIEWKYNGLEVVYRGEPMGDFQDQHILNIPISSHDRIESVLHHSLSRHLLCTRMLTEKQADSIASDATSLGICKPFPLVSQMKLSDFALQIFEASLCRLPHIAHEDHTSCIPNNIFTIELTCAHAHLVELKLRFDINIEESSVACSILFAEELFDNDIIRHMSDQLQDILHTFSLPDFELSTPVLYLPIAGFFADPCIAGPVRDFGHACCLHQLIYEQSLRHSEAIALTFGEESMTYAQMEEKSILVTKKLLQELGEVSSLPSK